jgi:hypothetical protein
MLRLVEEAAKMYPGNEKLYALLAQMTEVRAGGDSSGTPRLTLSGGLYPTLVRTGSDRADESLEAVRAEVGTGAELLYITRDSAAVAIPGPGDASAQIAKRKLRVGAETAAVGGGNEGTAHLLSRNESQRLLLAEIQDYSRANPDFEVVYLDDPVLPSRLVIEFMAPGFAPPENLEVFLATTKHMPSSEYNALPFGTLEPVPIRHHRVTMELPPQFPTALPFIIWNTPIFHPNIWPQGRPGFRTGTLFVPQLTNPYSTELSFRELFQTLVNVASYKVYDAEMFPDLPAALWTRSRFGHARIGLTQSQASPSDFPGNEQLQAMLPGVGADPPRQFHTLTLIGSERHDEFLRLVRQLVDADADQCYTISAQSGQLPQSTVLIGDPGPRAAQIEEQLLAEVQDWDEGVDVAYQVTEVRPYLLRRLVVSGSDNGRFELRNVPSTTVLSEIVRAVLQFYTDDSTRARRGRIRTTINRIGADGQADRLDPGRTLSAAGIQDGDELRLATEAMAGTGTALW